MHVYFLSSLLEQAATDGNFLFVQNIEDYFITAKAHAMAISSKNGTRILGQKQPQLKSL